ncbi:MAG: tripartite tricarboxylate transporter substrate binding protein BugD, partial [Serpentinimonas sp.]|nr:tripartite tricarboxylate transporter substrate binding protein BugD [Serpentinimonas sp.]
MKKLLTFALAATAMAGAMAQDFPSRPITIVVPFTAGGPTDTVARQLAEAMRPHLGNA